MKFYVNPNKSLVLSALLLANVLTAHTHADDKQQYDHFAGKDAKTLQEALVLFKEYNHSIKAILTKGDPSPMDMHKIHELTYTIENALARINSESQALAATLEQLHKASEHSKPKETSHIGKSYLDKAYELFQ